MSRRNEDKKAIPILVPSEDPEKKDDLNNKKSSAEKATDLSEEDIRIKEEVSLLAERAMDANIALASEAIKQLTSMLQTATGSVASIPKPLKFIRAHYQELKEQVKSLPENHATKKGLYDILALVAMTMEIPDSPHEALTMKLQGTQDDLAAWGYQFVRHLAGNIGKEWNIRLEKEESIDDLIEYVHQIVTYMLEHQDEAAAVDLAIEINQTERIVKFCSDETYARVAQYLVAISKYIPTPDDQSVLSMAFQLYLNHKNYTQALRVAMILQNAGSKVSEIFEACEDEDIKKQLALMCGRAKFFHVTEDSDLDELIGNNRVSELFRVCGKDLDSMAPKTPEELYKEHLMDKHLVPQTANSHMHNLASSFVNAFANAGFGTDTLLTEQGTNWIFQTKEHRMMSATASLGVIHLWDHENGLIAVDKYSYSEDNNIKAGALLGTGILMSGVRNDFDPALGMLSEYVSNASREIRIAAIVGLGFAYAGTQKEDVKELLIPIIADGSQPLEVQCLAAHALSLVFVGTCNEDVTETTMMCLMEKTETDLKQPCVRYLVLALGLLVLQKGEQADALLEGVRALPPLINKYAEVVVLSSAYACTGNVITVQRLFSIIADREEEDDEAKAAAVNPELEALKPGASADAAAKAAEAAKKAEEAKKDEDTTKAFNHKTAAVVGIAVVALGEELGSTLTKRSALHILLAKEDRAKSGRRAVPLALALLNVSDPSMQVVETLSKLSHDSDAPTAQAAILGLGIVSAGTNNARVATLLRQLSGYYSKEKDRDQLFVVRLAQGLCALGKGHITLSPFVSDGLVLNKVSLSGLLTVAHSALDIEKTILDKYHYMLYSTVLAMTPRMLIAVDSDLNPVQTQVRVGLGVDTVAVAGKPKSITGFQTHQTPVLLQAEQRAELVPEGKHSTDASILDGIIIVKKKAEADVDEDAAASK